MRDCKYKCDVCKKDIKDKKDLKQIAKNYETVQIKDVCKKCVKKIDKKLAQYNKKSSLFVKIYMHKILKKEGKK